MADRVVSYAQNREDIILSSFFGDVKTGFYVDVGANYPVEDSVTKYFYQRGWNGINIEPNKTLYSMLERDRPRDTNLCIGISDKKGELELREYPAHGLSTFSAGLKAKYLNDESDYVRGYKDYKVEVDTLNDIFIKQKVKQINFMKVDVEGYEYEVLAGNDWDKFRPEVLCIEANHIEKDWRPLIAGKKYSLVFFDGLNEYYVADERAEIANKFSYVDTMLPANKVINFYIYDEINMHKKTVRLQHKEIIKLQSRNQELNANVIALNQINQINQDHLASVRYLTKQLSKTLRSRINKKFHNL